MALSETRRAWLATTRPRVLKCRVLAPELRCHRALQVVAQAPPAAAAQIQQRVKPRTASVSWTGSEWPRVLHTMPVLTPLPQTTSHPLDKHLQLPLHSSREWLSTNPSMDPDSVSDSHPQHSTDAAVNPASSPAAHQNTSNSSSNSNTHSSPSSASSSFKRKWPCGMKRFKYRNPLRLAVTATQQGSPRASRLMTHRAIMTGLYYHYRSPVQTRVLEIQVAGDPSGASRVLEVPVEVGVVRGPPAWRQRMSEAWAFGNGSSCVGSISSDSSSLWSSCSLEEDEVYNAIEEEAEKQHQQQDQAQQQQQQQCVGLEGLEGHEAAPSSDDVYPQSQDASDCQEASLGSLTSSNTGGGEETLMMAVSSQPDEVEVVEVPFAVRCPTEPGQRLFITGNVPSLGGWNLSNALKLKWSPDHVWRGTIKLPRDFMDKVLEFKAVLLNEASSSWVWQQGPNHKCKVMPSMSAVKLVFQ